MSSLPKKHEKTLWKALTKKNKKNCKIDHEKHQDRNSQSQACNKKQIKNTRVHIQKALLKRLDVQPIKGTTTKEQEIYIHKTLHPKRTWWATSHEGKQQNIRKHIHKALLKKAGWDHTLLTKGLFKETHKPHFVNPGPDEPLLTRLLVNHTLFSKALLGRPYFVNKGPGRTHFVNQGPGGRHFVNQSPGRSHLPHQRPGGPHFVSHGPWPGRQHFANPGPVKTKAWHGHIFFNQGPGRSHFVKQGLGRPHCVNQGPGRAHLADQCF